MKTVWRARATEKNTSNVSVQSVETASYGDCLLHIFRGGESGAVWRCVVVGRGVGLADPGIQPVVVGRGI